MIHHKLKILLAGLFVLISLVALRIYDPFFVETARLKGLDYYQRAQQKELSDKIVVVEIDEASLEQNGQWPWSRDVLAKAIEKAYKSEAMLVVVPILFAEKDRLGKDVEFVNALKQYPAITAQSASLKGKGVPVPRGLAIVGYGADQWLFDFPNAIGPVKEIGESSLGVGMLLTAPELDGVVRRLPLVVQVKGEIYPTFPLEILRVFSEQQSYQAKVNEAGIQAIRVKGSSPILTDANARVWINFKYNFEKISFIQQEWNVKGKIVVIALSAEGLVSSVATSLGVSTGHEVQLQVLQSLLSDSRLQRLPEADLYELSLGLLVCCALIASAIYLGYVLNGVLIVNFIILPVIAGNYLFTNYGLLTDFTWIVLAASVVWAVCIFFRFIMEFKLKQQIKKQFGTYLAPALVEKLQKNPGLLKLGGDERELSIMFTDVGGFTTISEHYGKNVQGLTMIMNRYMTAMTQSILDNDGTLDKYIGDAQMAFWNAPLDDPDHAKNAVKTALQMLKRLDIFNEEISKEGVPPFGMGLGINTGSVVVGNMGSAQRFDYTCLGDHVNLASRLEGQSKPYGVRIIIGPRTYEHVKDNYQCFELDCIAVKGKKEGVRIYTVLEHELGVVEKKSIIAIHHAFLHNYRIQKWDEAVLLAESLIKHNKELKKYYQMMIERIKELQQQNLDSHWDGVYRATSK